MKALNFLFFLLAFLFTTTAWSSTDFVIYPIKKALKEEVKAKGEKGKIKVRFYEKALTKLLKKQIKRRMKQHLLYGDSTRCDTLYLFSGRQVLGKVLEVSEENIKYRKCATAADSTIVRIRNISVESIHYNGGQVTTLKELWGEIDRPNYEENSPNNEPYFEEGKEGIAPFFIGFFCGLLLSFLGIIIALIIYKGNQYGQIVIGCLVGSVTLIALTLLLFLLFISL